MKTAKSIETPPRGGFGAFNSIYEVSPIKLKVMNPVMNI